MGALDCPECLGELCGFIQQKHVTYLCASDLHKDWVCVEGIGLAKQADLAEFTHLTKTCYIMYVCVQVTFIETECVWRDWACKTGRSSWLGFPCACCQMEWECTLSLLTATVYIQWQLTANTCTHCRRKPRVDSTMILSSDRAGRNRLAGRFRCMCSDSITRDSAANVYVFVMLGCKTNRLNIGRMPRCKYLLTCRFDYYDCQQSIGHWNC